MSEKTRVLVVDDEERFAANMVKILQENGMEAWAAHSGEQALEVLDANSFDVVLLDVKMPGLSGVGTLRKMKEKEYDVKVVVLTGHASVDDAVHLLDLGAVDYLLKPCRTPRLLEMIRLAKEAKELQQEARAAKDLKEKAAG